VRQAAHVLLGTGGSPHRVALAFGIGVFIAFFPILGLHTGIALLVAYGFGLSRVALLAGCWTNNPWTLGPMFLGGTLVGCALLGVPSAGLQEIQWDLQGQAFYDALWASLRPYVLPFVVGNLASGAVAGLLSYAALRAVLERRAQRVA
jgi:hypothetical protein